jgi:pimeloyl-ACP methyl ester carboxylesterase
MMPFLESGNPSNPSIVFLHGGPLSSAMWRPQLASPSLAPFHLIAPDLPGHGLNTDAFSLAESAGQVDKLIRTRASGGKAALVGLSLGGSVVFELLRTFPERVSRAMVSGTSGRLGRILGGISLASAGLVGALPKEWQARTMLDQLAVPESMRHLIDDLVKGLTPEYTRDVVRALMGLELPERIECPLLVAVGGSETWAARNAARTLLEKYPQARGITVPGKHHLWNLEDSELFSKTLRAWTTDTPLPIGVTELGSRKPVNGTPKM